MSLSGTVFLSEARIATLRARVNAGIQPTIAAFARLQDEACDALRREPQVPAVWYVPGYYRDPAGHREAKAGLECDANAAYTLALRYRIAGGEAYARAALRIIDAWATNLRRLEYTDDSTLSFSYHCPALVFAAGLLRRHADWPQERQVAFSRFLRERSLPMNTAHRVNNWGNWGLVLMMSVAAYLTDADLMAQAVARWREFIDIQIAQDGHLPHEVTRNNGIGEHGIWYSHFTLMPQTLAAEVARVNGVDLYDYVSPSGRTLRLAYERLVPWAHRPETFPYYRGAESGQAGTDYVSYWEILNARWPHPVASAMLAERRPLSATHSTPHLTVTHGDLLNDA